MRRSDWVPVGALRVLGIDLPPHAVVRPRSAGRTAPLPARVDVSEELLWLLGLYVAEGCYQERSGGSYLVFSGDEELLERAAKVVDRDLGLHVVRAPEQPGVRSASLFVHSKLLLRVMDSIGFDRGRKRIPGWILGLPLDRLKWFIEGYREGDGVHSGKKFDEAVRHEFSTVSDELKDDLVVALTRFGIVASVGRYETTFKQRTGDRTYPFWRVTVPRVAPWSPLEWDQGVEQVLQAKVTGDLVWAPITAIEEIEATPLVYDFSVPGLENFWAGTGVMAHNTYGERMRPLDGRVVSNFIIQALQGKPITIYGDGSQTRSFCHVEDEVRGLLALFDSDCVGPVNIGNPNEFTIRELAEVVHRGHQVELRDHLRAAAGRRSDAAPARHHPGPHPARVGAAGPAARGHRAHRGLLRPHPGGVAAPVSGRAVPATGSGHANMRTRDRVDPRGHHPRAVLAPGPRWDRPRRGRDDRGAGRARPTSRWSG